MSKTFSPVLQCPKCYEFLYISGHSRHETLTEHVTNPNGTPSMKPEYRCPNKCYPTRVFWDHYGDAYIGSPWLQRFLWKFGVYGLFSNIEVGSALYFTDGIRYIRQSDGTLVPHPDNKLYFQRCPHCDGRAWRYKQEPYSTMVITAARIEHKAEPKPGDPMTCQECGKAISADYCSMDTLIVDNKV